MVFSFINDNATNLLTTNGLVMSGVYHQHFGSGFFVSMGMQGGVFQRRIDIDKITTDNQFLFGFFDPDAAINEDLFNASIGYFTWSAGMVFRKKDFLEREKLYLGFSYNNINKPSASLLKENSASNATKIPQNFTITGGWNIYQGENVAWMPNFRWINRLGNNLLNIGSRVNFTLNSEKNLLKKGSVNLGLWYNTNKAVIMAAEFHQTKYWFGLSYDLATSSNQLTIGNNGVFELSFGLKIPRKIKSIQPIEDTTRQLWLSLVPLTRKHTLIQDDLKEKLLGEIPEPLVLFKMESKNVDNQIVKSRVFIKDTVLVQVRRIEKNAKDTLTINSLKQVNKALIQEEKNILNQKIRFEINSNSVSSAYQNNLNDLVNLLMSKPNLNVIIIGHTCDVGSDEENLELSKVRAEAVKQYLMNQGITPSRLRVMGMGNAFPLVPNTNDYNRNINRRVEFKVLPN